MVYEEKLEQIIHTIFPVWGSLLRIGNFEITDRQIVRIGNWITEDTWNSMESGHQPTITVWNGQKSPERAYVTTSEETQDQMTRLEFLCNILCRGDEALFAEVFLRALTQIFDLNADLSPAFASSQRLDPHPADALVEKIRAYLRPVIRVR